MFRPLSCVIFSLLFALFAQAQDLVVVNSASYIRQELPNGGIAQGSIFVGFGSGMGPATIAYPLPWPFPTELAGTRIAVTVGGTTVDCFLVYTSAGQVAAILPSATPLGSGTVTVSYNGSVAATGEIEVVAHNFGIFTINQRGFGPAVATNPLASSTVYSVKNSAKPAGIIDIWGTGLGAVGVPDEGPTAGSGNLGYDVHVFVAGVEVPVEYAGRSGCCSAVDIVRIVLPEGLTGCYLPVTVVVGGKPSNYGTFAADPVGNGCSSDPVFGMPDFTELSDGGIIRGGTISLIRTRQPPIDSSLQAQRQTADVINDAASATYQELKIDNVAAFAGAFPITQFGACVVYPFANGTAAFPQSVEPIKLDAGPQLNVQGPGGDRVLPKVSGGSYLKNFGAGSSDPQQSGMYYEPGQTTVTAPGGADVQAHMATMTVPPGFEWLNRPATGDAIDRTQPFTVQYAAADYDYVVVGGSAIASAGFGALEGAGFFCLGDPSANSLTIPREVLMGLPDTPVVFGTATGGLNVAGYKVGEFEAVGVDLNTFLYSDTSIAIVDYN